MSREVARQGQAAVALRVNGTSFADIADTLGLGDARAAMALVARELAENLPNDDESRERIRRELSVRIESVIAGLMGKATNPDDPEHLPAVNSVVKVFDRFSKLHGLDEPARVQVYTPAQAELDEWVSKAIAHSMPELEEGDIVEGEIVQ